MRPTDCDGQFFRRAFAHLTRALVVAGFFVFIVSARAQLDPGGGSGGPTNVPLESWSFYDATNWTADDGLPPVSFTNLNYSNLGNGRSLVVDTNVPAWLQYPVWNTNGGTNLTVDNGSVTFWFAPNWSSVGDTNGGFGPGDYGRLLEAGRYTDDSSYGWWSVFMDAGGTNLYFAAQTNDLSSNMTVYLSAPIDWRTNYFHFVALTYSPTNTSLYFDGALATNGPGLTVYPGPEVLTNGFYLGSDASGTNQAHGLFNTVQTYNYPLNSNDVAALFDWYYTAYILSPWNTAMENLSGANYSPSTNMTPNVVTGQGNLQILGAAPYISSTNPYVVWITNLTSTVAADGTMTVTFAIEGGQDGYAYDVFAGTALTAPLGNGNWAWQGQGQHCLVYSLAGLPPGTVFLVLGTPLDTDGDGLTDAYELLVSKTNPDNAYSNLDGISDGWEVLLGLNPHDSNTTDPAERANYGYTPADWLNGVSGVKSGTIATDNEGNVLSVSQ